MGRQVVDRIARFMEALPERRADNPVDPAAAAELIAALFRPPPEQAGDLTELLGRVDQARDCAFETAGPGFMAGVPGGGLYVSALAEFYARAINRYGSFAFGAPALAALEESVLRWIAQEVCGMPAGSSGFLTTGGSLATLSAVVTARESRLGEDIAQGTIYVTEYTHHSVAKAAWLAGIKRGNVRVVPCTDELRMDLCAASALIREDRKAGRRPFLLAATAGTTVTGAIDPLSEMAALARQEGLWLHVDAAYGGFFRLTSRGRQRLAGLEQADSIALDPHKSLFLPFGTGALVVREPALLAAAHAERGSYMQDAQSTESLPNYSDLSPELTREVRGLRVWLPLHLHGVAAFRAELDEKLDLAEQAHRRLAAVPTLELPWAPELSTVAFRVRPRDASPAAVAEADQATVELLQRINSSGRVFLMSAVAGGRQIIRVCILGHRTHQDRVAEALDIIVSAATERRTAA
ncbi:pyridoxal phosphate-dependent decarboxylase family protein [Hyalangium gracile]|uniref:pyridoxal phosphate-dependent decarboxylase family protein n=1 Tax=Hyalangium gracile TaxID=394092 RepID=UPI001CCDD5AB|nr:aminotransferase class V-fold PLP-dependent enzyme [Hyalangium gracile]